MPALPERKHILRLDTCSAVREYALPLCCGEAERRFGSREDNRMRDGYKEMHIKTKETPASNCKDLLSINH